MHIELSIASLEVKLAIRNMGNVEPRNMANIVEPSHMVLFVPAKHLLAFSSPSLHLIQKCSGFCAGYW